MSISLLERLNEGVSRPSNSFSNEKLSRSLPPSSQYALSKVIEKMLGGKSKQASQWEDNYYFTLLEQNDNKTAEEQRILDAAKADLCLIVSHKGIIRVMAHLEFEEYWNLIGEKERAATSVLKKYWLGQGFQIDVNNMRNLDQLSLKIAERLVNDIALFCERYKAYREGTEKQDMAVRKYKKDTIDIDKGSWSSRVYFNWSKVGMDKTTHLNNLLVSLYETNTIPKDCPLNEFETDLLLEKLNLKPQTQPKKEGAKNV